MSASPAPLKVVESTDEFGFRTVLNRQRLAFETERYPSYQLRHSRLQQLKQMLHGHREQIVEALMRDFGHRSREETLIAEIASTVAHIEYVSKNLANWMRPKARSTSIWFLPGSNRIQAQPLGVVGVMVPWNYPINLALVPLIAAMAAGNRVMIKMSEYTPASTKLLRNMLRQVFPEDLVAVFGGDAPASAAFSALPFDHLMFTGSTAVGRKVMQAAAPNLTPVTLELGGKSPVIIGADADLEEAAERILWGKVFNAGQTCVAPDYLLVPRGSAREIALQMGRAYARFLPEGASGADYSAIIDQRNYDRLSQTLELARSSCEEVLPLEPLTPALSQARKLPTTLLINPAADSRVMREEIFGPLLPIIEVDDVGEAVDRVNSGDRPLALYYFGHSEREQDFVLRNTHAGGV
ncbi:MAG: aldehyde dehydrogenase family protein, partial [Oceanococcaceae bacterium]